MTSTVTQYDGFLKDYYTKKQIAQLVFTNRPLWARCTKDPGQSGRRYIHPVMYGNAQGLGATRAAAQTGATQGGGRGNLYGDDWQCLFGYYAGSVEVSDRIIRASRNDMGAFLRNQKIEVDTLYEAFGNTFAYYIYANSGMALCTGTISSGVVTLVAGKEDDICNIDLGMIIQASANDGTSSGHTLLGSGSLGYVIAVNRNAGTFTVSSTDGGAAATPASWSGTMFFFRNADFGGDVSPNRIILGLGAWIPATDPSSTAFEGIDRTKSMTALSGLRLPAADISGLGIEQRIKKLCSRMAGRGGSKPAKEIYLHSEKWQELADSLESRGVRDVGVKDAQFGYMSLKLATPGGIVDVYADPFCPNTTIWATNPEYIVVGSYDDVPTVLNGDGLTMLRKANSDDFEHRIVAYPALCVPAPGYQGRVPTP